MDSNLQKINSLHKKVRQEVIDTVEYINSKLLTGRSKMKVTYGYRSFEEQDALYAKGRTKPGPKVTNAKAGSSIHQYGLALDYCLVIDNKDISWDDLKDYDGDHVADWLEVAKEFIRRGWEWGGYWKSIVDKPHLQKTFGNSWQTLLTKYNKGQTFTENGIKYVNI